MGTFTYRLASFPRREGGKHYKHRGNCAPPVSEAPPVGYSLFTGDDGQGGRDGTGRARAQRRRGAAAAHLGAPGAATLLTAAAALCLNAIVYLAGRTLLDLPDDVSVLTPGAVVLSTLAGTVLGAAGLAALARHVVRPVSTFRRLAVLVGLLSLLGPLAAAVGLVADGPGVGGSTFVTLALMNLATTAAIILVLPPAAAVQD